MRTRRERILEILLSTAPPTSVNRAGSQRLEIAGCAVDVCAEDPTSRDVLAREFAAFRRIGSRGAELSIEIEAPGPELLPAELWEDPDAEYEFRGSAIIQRDFAALRLPPEAAGGPERIRVWLNPNELGDAIHNLVRAVLPSLLLRHDAFLLHGAAVIKDGRGHVFFGPSGAGKSTCVGMISRADAQATVVGDDAVVVGLCAEGLTLFSAPVGSGHSRAAPPAVRVPVAGLYWLRQGDDHRVVRLSPGVGAWKLISCAMSATPSGFEEERLALVERMSAVPGFVDELIFARDAGFWPIIAERNPNIPRGPTL